MSFQQGGGWVDEEEWGWMVDVGGGGGYCTRCTYAHSYQLPLCIENKEEVKTEAPRTQISQFVRFSPQRQEKKEERGQYR